MRTAGYSIVASVLSILLLVLCWTSLSRAQEEQGSAEALLQQRQKAVEDVEGWVADFKNRLDKTDADIDLLKKDIRDLKDTMALISPVPFEEENGVKEEDIQELNDEVEALKAAVACLKPTSDLESIPLPEELLADELFLGKEESNWERIVIPLIVIVVVMQIAFWGGVYWRERRLRTRKDMTAYPIETDASEKETEAPEEEGPESVSAEDEKAGSERAHEGSRMKRKRVLVPVLCFAAGMIVLLFAMKEVAAFIDKSAMIVVFAGSLLFTMAHFSLREIVESVRYALSGIRLEAEEADRARLVFRTLDNYVLGLGILGFFIGLIVMLKNMDDPAQIGPGMALALLSILYAVGFSKIVVMPLELRIAQCLEAPQSSNRNTGLLLSVMVSVMAVLTFFVLLLSFSSVD